MLLSSADEVRVAGVTYFPRWRFTLHLDFNAVDPDLAAAVAATLVHGLGTLCPNVEVHSARVSPPGLPELAHQVFCLAPGPDGAACEDLDGHPGQHSEAGVSGLRWDREAGDTSL
jgi:hypothetical protein